MDFRGLVWGEPMANQKKAKLTDNDCRALKCPKGKKNVSVYHPTVNGLILRCTRKGIKSWVFRFTYKNKRIEQKLGLYPKDLSLKDAVHLAYEWHGALRANKDPRTVAELQPAPDSSLTFRSKQGPRFIELWNQFMKVHRQTIKKSSAENYDDMFAAHLSKWGHRHISDIKTSELSSYYWEHVDAGMTTGHAKKIFTMMSKAITHHQIRGADIENPCVAAIAQMKVKRIQRERTLTDRELRYIWNAGERPDYRMIWRCLLLNGTRITETAMVEWSDIDFKKRIWTIRPIYSKNNHAHRIPMANWTLELLNEWKKNRYQFVGKRHPMMTNKRLWRSRLWEETELVQRQWCDKYVFPYCVYTANRAKGWDHTKVCSMLSQAKRRMFSEVEWLANDPQPFTHHDGRRTVADRLQGLVDEENNRLHPYTNRAALNHRGANCTTEQYYAKFEPAHWVREHKQGLEVWAKELRSIVDPTPANTGSDRRGLRLVS